MIKTTLNDIFSKKEVKGINGMLHKNDAIHQNSYSDLINKTSRDNIFFVYFYNKKPIGFLSYYTNNFTDENYIQISFIFVNKKYRHRGIADTLRSAFIKFIKSEGNIEKIYTLSKAKPEMYKKYGFQISQTRKAQPPYEMYELNLN